MYNVLVVDDHPIFRKGVVSLVNDLPDFQVAAESDNGTDAFVRVGEGDIDIVVTDILMPPGESGISATRRIHEKYPDVKVIVLAMQEEHKYINSALHVGAAGYVLKSSPCYEFVNALKTVVTDRIFVDVNIVLVKSDFKEIDSKQADEQLYYYGTLSKREQEVLPLMALGCSNKEIAGRLHITTKTVEAHKSSIMRKLDFPSHGELVHYAVRHQFVTF